VSKLDNKPAPDRSLHLLSPILFPIEEPPPHRTGKQAATATEPGHAKPTLHAPTAGAVHDS
jgi:hypothetical protein